MSTPAMLTCAVSGGVITGNPNQPADRDAVISEALGAAHAGASIVHIHARTLEGEMTQAPEDYLAIKQAIRDESDVVLNFTTGGKLGAPPQERRRSLQAQPELASLNCGSLNFGPDDVVFLNPKSLIGELAEEMAERGIVPEYECFDIGMAVTAAELECHGAWGEGNDASGARCDRGRSRERRDDRAVCRAGSGRDSLDGDGNRSTQLPDDGGCARTWGSHPHGP